MYRGGLFGEKVFKVVQLPFEHLVFGPESCVVELQTGALFDRPV